MNHFILVEVIFEAGERCGIPHCTKLKAGPVTSPSIPKPFSLHFFFFFFVEVLRLGVKSEVQLLAYATATATQDPSRLL